MLLRPGESILRSAYAVMGGRELLSNERGPGVLYLTNQRLVFESHVSRGVVRDLVGGREARILLDESLHEVRNASIRRGRVGSSRLVVETSRARPAFDVLEPDEWLAAIADARRELSVPSAPGPSAVHTIVREVVKVRCRYCGQLGNEVDGRCPSCGAAL